MSHLSQMHVPGSAPRAHATWARSLKIVALCAIGLGLAGCRPDGSDGTQVAGWTLIDPAQRHPILVSEKPETLSLRVSRGSQGLTPAQRARLIEFAERFRSRDSGQARLVVAAPSGSANEVDAMAGVQEIRAILADRGFAESSIVVEAYAEDSDPQPPIRVSYTSYTAEAPKCGNWSTNLARQPDNLPYADFGCATQRNFAAQIANPADLLGPRTMTPRPADRRVAHWEKYNKGESTAAQKVSDERVNTNNSGAQ